MTHAAHSEHGNGADEPVVRDRRRIDPQTGEVRPGAGATQPAPAAAPPGADVPAGAGIPPGAGPSGAEADQQAQLQAELAERTGDLQRVQADFANFRRRVERDRAAVAEQALASVLTGLLPVLDDIDRARAHGEVEGGFKLVADGLETTLTKLGLERFGSPGDPFDPTVHEALTHGFSADVSEPTCADVLQPGYRLGDRVLRAARVAVVEPGEMESTPENGA